MRELFVKICFLSLICVCMLGCKPGESQQQSEESDEVDLPAPTTVNPPLAAADQLDGILTAYLNVKDSFVKSDTVDVNHSISDLILAVSKVDTTKLSTKIQTKWRDTRAMLIRTATTLKAVPDLEDKREAFEDLSKIMYEVVNTYGAKTVVYKQYCPMALEDKGAYWLSVNKEIKNPYFGNKMLECGEVQQVLTFNK